MDNSNHIDESFKQRFADLKDHSANPAEQWTKFEPSLNVLNPLASAGHSSSILSGSMLKLAASLVSVISLAGLTTQDVQNRSDTANEFNVESFGVSAPNLTQNVIVPLGEVIAHESPSQHEVVANTSLQKEIINQDAVPILLAESNTDNAQNFSEKANSSIGGMLPVSKESRPALIVDDHRPLPPRSLTPKYYSPVSYYARAAIRIGNGESNSRVIENSATLNGVLGVGLAYSISPNTFLSIEANYLRRSGNGIERSKDYDIGPIVSAFSNSNYINSNEFSADDFRVQKSLVATNLNYVHLPIMVHVVLNSNSNASIGFYTDYLLSVHNESFMIYNSEHYITTQTFLAEERSKKGLNSMRYGLMAGYEHSVNSKVSLNARAMLPITSSYDRSSEYDIEREPNQLVDLNIGLIYKI